MTENTYTVLRAAHLYGKAYSAGGTIELTEGEAKYPVMNGVIEPVKSPMPEPEAGTEPPTPPKKPRKKLPTKKAQEARSAERATGKPES